MLRRESSFFYFLFNILFFPLCLLLITPLCEVTFGEGVRRGEPFPEAPFGFVVKGGLREPLTFVCYYLFFHSFYADAIVMLRADA